MAWSDAYAVLGNRYGITGPYYGAAGHRGQDFLWGYGKSVPTYVKGRVVGIHRSTVLGYCTVIEILEGPYKGRFAGWAHLQRSGRPAIGTILNVGDQVGRVAGVNDYHGSAWAGSHIHTTLTQLAGGIFSGTTYDPLPAIRNAIANVSGASSGEGIKINVVLDYNADKSIFSRIFKYDVREGETAGATIWERFSHVFDAVKGVRTVVDYQATRREQINQRNEDIHNAQSTVLKSILDKINAGVPVNLTVNDQFAQAVADKVAAKLTETSTVNTEGLAKAIATETVKLLGQ